MRTDVREFPNERIEYDEEALRLECLHFLECIRERRQLLSDGRDGLQVVKVLEAAQRSLRKNGLPMPIEPFG